jgi:pyruvate carboxylase subunit B
VKYKIEVGGRVLEVEVDGARIVVDGRTVDARLHGAPGSAIRRLHRGRSTSTVLAAPGDGRGAWTLSMEGCRFAVQVLDAREQAVRAAGSRGGGAARSGALRAPMPGKVVRVLVQAGDQVEAGQGVVVLEAMKMENELKATGPGTVRTVHVRSGALVERGAPLLDIE